MLNNSIGEIVRKAENDYRVGNTEISRYVSHSMRDTLDTIDAYINSKHISGTQDSLGRDKPFFNIVTSAVNVWYRATDIDRSQIKLRATKSKEVFAAFLLTVHLQEWMRKDRFGVFLNEWGRTLSRYGSAIVKFVQNENGLHAYVAPWNQMIVDAVAFDDYPKIEILQLTEAELYRRVETHGYDYEQVKALCEAVSERENSDKRKKDNKSGFIKLYEVHGQLPLTYITGNELDENRYVQQMHVISFVGVKKGRQTEYRDYTLYKGKEKKDPYMITHLIPEDGRTLSIGAVEHLFEAQWMVNHSMKAIKDQLDLASRLVFQTSDTSFVGRNVLADIETGDIFVHKVNEPVTQMNNQSHDLVSGQNFAVQWKQLGNEIVGISEAMLGAQPKSGTAWRQTEAMLQESYNLFELMRQNKGLHIEDMMREWVIPYLKTKMDSKEEISATLEDHAITELNAIYVPNKAIKNYNKYVKEQLLKGLKPQQFEKDAEEAAVAQSQPGNQRFFKPDELGEKTWNEVFKDIEYKIEIDVTGETKNVQEAMTTLNTALRLVVTPGFEQNKKAQAIVGKMLELAGAMSPLEYSSIPTSPAPQEPQKQPAKEDLQLM